MAQSSHTVGSSLSCSSPTSAFAIASRMARLGRVWVSLKRSILGRSLIFRPSDALARLAYVYESPAQKKVVDGRHSRPADQ